MNWIIVAVIAAFGGLGLGLLAGFLGWMPGKSSSRTGDKKISQQAAQLLIETRNEAKEIIARAKEAAGSIDQEIATAKKDAQVSQSRSRQAPG